MASTAPPGGARLLTNLVDRCVPPVLRAAPEEECARARALVLVAVLGMTAGVAYGAAYLSVGSTTAGATILVGAAGAVPAVLLLRHTGSVSLVANLLISLLLEVVILAGLVTGGVTAPAMTWCAVIPVAAVTIAGLRQGVVWTGVVLIGLSAVSMLETSVYVVAEPLAATHRWIHSAELGGAVMFVAMLVGAQELFKGRLLGRAEKSEKEYREILETMQEGYYETDLAGNIVFANRALSGQFGYRHDELIGMSWRECVQEDSVREVFRTFNGVYRTGRPARAFDWVIARRSGERRAVEASISQIRDADGHPAGFRGVIRDITERRRAEEERAQLEAELRKSQKIEAVGRLASGAAHDLNNLLVPILGRGELLLDQLSEDDPVRPSVQQMVDAALKSRDLVSQLLAFVGRQALKIESLNLNRLLEDFYPLLRSTIREDIDMTLATAADLPAVRADGGQLEQVVMNLAVNAQDAMPEGGHLLIETGVVDLDRSYAATHPGVTPGRYVMLAVTDSGQGMDGETAERAFEPFFTTKAPGKGTGLGLSTVYGILKQHGGNVWIYSEPGRGTTFKCYLPAVADTPRASVDEQRPVSSTGSGETILVVEDDHLVRNLAVEVLEANGYTVVSAAGLTECLALLRDHDGPVDLVLTDVVMPEADGKAVVARVKARYPSVKVLYMSGYTENVIAHRGVLDDGVTFIQKPFTVSDLVVKVRSLLDRS